jgi:hypothetical protein
MATKHYVGDDGKITFSSGVVASVTSWTVDAVADTAEDTVMNNGGWKTHISSLKSWSGSCEIRIEIDDTTGVDTSAADVPLGTTGAAEFYADAAIAAQYSGDIIVNGYSASAAIGDTITASVSFQGTGALSGI